VDPINPLTVVAAALLAVIIASLPDMSSPGIVPFGMVLGGFLGAASARARRLSAADVRNAAEAGAFFGTAIGLTLYLIALAVGL
jgi:hypothetical protein